MFTGHSAYLTLELMSYLLNCLLLVVRN